MGDLVRAAVVVAGGTAERFGRSGGKQLAPLVGRPVLSWVLDALDTSGAIDLIVVVCAPDRADEYRSIAVEPLELRTPVIYAAGGSTRRESVASGLAALPDSVVTVLVHDGARPLVTGDLIVAALSAFERSGADGLVVGHPSIDTLKIAEGPRVVETPPRESFWAVQTPQVFSAEALKAAHRLAIADGFEGTDDASLVERAGGVVVLHEGPRDNIKITLPEDLAFAEAVIRARAEGGA